MIRTATKEDLKQLELLYSESLFQRLPKLVKWALKEAPERMLVVGKTGEILAAVYTMVCVYNNFWSSYLASKDEASAKNVIDYLVEVREERKLRNLYVFCPKELVDTRLHLIARGFIPECMRKIDGIDYIVESYDGSFNLNYQISKPKKHLSVVTRRVKK